jgi:hypothetical protein
VYHREISVADPIAKEAVRIYSKQQGACGYVPTAEFAGAAILVTCVHGGVRWLWWMKPWRNRGPFRSIT